MTDDGRSPLSVLKGRLADVYVPALVSGALSALARRLGDRATIDDPRYGRCVGLASIEPLLAQLAAGFTETHATYTQLVSTAGVDRDATEGRLVVRSNGETHEVPIAVVAERRRLREIELRVYYTHKGSRASRSALAVAAVEPPLLHEVSAPSIKALLNHLKRGLVTDALSAFEEGCHVVDPDGREYRKSDGALSTFLAGFATIDVVGSAEDSRTCCIEAMVTRSGREAVAERTPTLLAFERGDGGLVRELRVYSG